MSKLRVGDLVMVRSGKHRTKTGKIERLDKKSQKAWVAGLNMVKRHLKKSQRNPQGGIIQKHQPLTLSKLILIDPQSKKPTRIKIKVNGDSKARLTTKTNTVLEDVKKSQS